MYRVRVEDGFSAAHFLKNYHGKCEKLHGHNYRVRVWVRGGELDEAGMLADFVVLKDTLRHVLSELDHGLLNEHVAFADGNPSAERIARWVFEKMSGELPGVALWRVDVFETEKNMASYDGDDDGFDMDFS